MWSGLLPPGLNESDVDLSSEDGEESCISCLKEEDTKEDTERVQLPELQENGPESDAPAKSVPVEGGEDASETCPAGVPLNMWNKFLELQKKNREMKMQVNQGSRGRKRKRRKKGTVQVVGKKLVIFNEFYFSVFSSQQLANEDHWKELTQYFGINDRFESPVDSRAPQKSGLELSIEKSVAEGDIDKAEELSDRLATREVSGLLT
ncbi:hypothetical protein ASZ78_005193 [Callipepla squamata]|uniref:F204A protein n=1 Tax=Callipepla squamata TaxID=9009 RepID=A0A226N796_CALSU|nr:hypothetical protein ASZ78_005193 [Callipepla squamata]